MGAEQTPPAIFGRGKINKDIKAEPSAVKKDYYVPAILPKWEIAIYFLVWSAHAMIFSFVIVDNASQMHQNKFRHSLKKSPYFDGQLYDVSDTEWVLLKEGLRDFLSSMIGHFLLFNFGHKLLPKALLRWVLVGYWICLHIYLTNLTSVCLILVGSLFGALITSVCRHALPVWVLAIGFVLRANEVAPYDVSSTVIFYRQFNLYLYTAVQVINFCSYLAKNPHVRLIDTLPRYIEYLLYPPYSVTLIVLYEDFDRQMIEREVRTRESITQLVVRLIRLVFWFFFVEALLHRIFVNAIFQSDARVISQMGTYSISAVAFLAGQYFQVKYVVIFGLPAFFAYLDNMTPPGPPICISRVSKYAQMWRYFDRGLYEFLKIQVYLPLIGRKFSLWRRLGAMVVAFGFVLAWHGTSSRYLWWVSLSAAEIVVERVGAAVYSHQRFQDCFLAISPRMQRRLIACAQWTTTILGIFSIFFFLGGPGVGAVVIKRVLFDGLIGIFTGDIKWTANGPTAGFVMFHLFIVGYCFNHVCMTYEQADKEKRKRELLEAEKKGN